MVDVDLAEQKRVPFRSFSAFWLSSVSSYLDS